MQTEPATTTAPHTIASESARRVLEERQHTLLMQIQTRVRDVRSAGATQEHHASDATEADEAAADDVAFALLQIQSETLTRISRALLRLDDGTYGYCSDCGEEIAHSRLRALPFAVRCRFCEEDREQARHRDRQHAQRTINWLRV